MIEKKCNVCNTSFYVKKSKENTAKYCSKKCQLEVAGFKRGLDNPNRGESHPSWKGGISRTNCIDCNKNIRNRNLSIKRCRLCYKKYNRGENHADWQGGIYPLNCKKCNKAITKNATYCHQCRGKLYFTGLNNINWKGGITPQIIQIRNSQEYKDWRKYIYKRDKYKCALCNGDKILNAHHIRKFSDYPDLRFCKKNGITLCKRCHNTYVNYNEIEYQDYFDILILNREK